MSDPADTIAVSLELLSNAASVLLAHHDSLLGRAHNQGLSDAVAKRLSDRKTQGLYPTPPTSNQSVSRRSPVSITSVSLASNRSPSHRTCPLTIPRIRVLRSPKVVIPKSNHVSLSLQVSQLQSRAVTESREDGENENQASNPQIILEDSSGDELLHDNSRPRAQTGAAKSSNSTKTGSQRKSNYPASNALAAQLTQLSPIDWAFWIQAGNEVGYWRPLSDFPSATQVQFKRKFDADFLQTTRHIRQLVPMLKHCDRYLERDICVGNMTYWGRNKPSKWKLAGGNKKKTCDTCFRAGRFCARMVKVGDAVKLGVFPAVNDGMTAVDWRKIRHWIGKKTNPKGKEVAKRARS